MYITLLIENPTFHFVSIYMTPHWTQCLVLSSNNEMLLIIDGVDILQPLSSYGASMDYMKLLVAITNEMM